MTCPTADEVAVAIVAASRETGADPIRVASGDNLGGHGHVDVSRARAYAAMTLRAKTKASSAAISRAIGSGSPGVYLSSLKRGVANKSLSWWSAEAFQRVLGAVAAFQATMPPPEPENAPSKPAGPPRQRPDDEAILPDQCEGGLEIKTSYERVIAEETLDVPPFIPARPPRPVTLGKRALLEELRRAVENTARMGTPE
jgi:hypothetical protein